jgi:hypothetical protein
MKEELKKTGLANIWENQHENRTDKLGTITKERRDDTEGQNVFPMRSERTYLE